MIALIFFQRTPRGIFFVPMLFNGKLANAWQRSFFVPGKAIAAHKKETPSKTDLDGKNAMPKVREWRSDVGGRNIAGGCGQKVQRI